MDLLTLNDILFHNQAPWLEANQKQDKFKVLLTDTIQLTSNNNFYELEYLPALNPKCKYYRILIHNSIIEFLNHFSTRFLAATYPDQRKFLVVKALDKLISQKMTDTATVIAERNYNFPNINQPQNRAIRDEIYVIHLIKYSLVWLYLEIRELAKDQVNHDYLDEETLLASFFGEYEYDPLIKEVPEVIREEIKVERNAKTANKKFQPKSFDFRPADKGVLKYDEIVADPERFSIFEQKLYENGFIDEEYNFIPSKPNSHTEKFAKIALAMKEKGYLRKTNLGKPIKSKQYRDFIQHRYTVDIDRQYRNFENKPETVIEFIESTYWLSKLPKY